MCTMAFGAITSLASTRKPVDIRPDAQPNTKGRATDQRLRSLNRRNRCALWLAVLTYNHLHFERIVRTTNRSNITSFNISSRITGSPNSVLSIADPSPSLPVSIDILTPAYNMIYNRTKTTYPRVGMHRDSRRADVSGVIADVLLRLLMEEATHHSAQKDLCLAWSRAVRAAPGRHGGAWGRPSYS